MTGPALEKGGRDDLPCQLERAQKEKPRDIRPDRRRFQIPAPSRVRHPVEPAVEGGDVEAVEVRAAERAVRWATCGGKQVLLQHRAIGGKDRDAWTRPASLPTTGGDDFAVRVPAHAVDSARLPEVVQHGELTEGSIGLDGVGAELPHRSQVVVALREEQRPLIPGEQQSVRARGIEGQALDLP
ncbi:MAG: hypothetical protein K0S14_3133 [Thermomicrobiales bacterium]|nr:hypothetical protein [Thermomicrobiales bacterium]